MPEYADERIQDIIEEINTKYFLPNIQRPFVWKEEQIVRLFDSLVRGYPIGTFLFWETSGTEVRRRKFIDCYYKEYAKDFNIEKLGLEVATSTDKAMLVLDGQQRLQSLFIGLKGKLEDKELYFNLLSGQRENEEGILFDFQFRKSPPEKDEDSLWIRVKDLIAKFSEVETIAHLKKEIIMSYPLDPSYEGTVEISLEKFKNAMMSHKRISYFPMRKLTYEQVFDIFVRVNAWGTTLSKSDLLFSFMKLKWKGFEAEKEFPKLLYKINGKDQFDFDVDFVLKSSLVLLDLPVKYSVKTFAGEKGASISKSIEENWIRIKSTIKTIVDLLQDFGINNKRLLPSKNAVMPILYYAYKDGKEATSDFSHDDKVSMRKWLLNVLLAATFSGQSDTMLEDARKAINSGSGGAFPARTVNAEFAKSKKSEVDRDIIKETSYGSAEACLLLYLAYPYGTNFNPSNRTNLPEQDHIFSQHELEDLYPETEISRIGNIRLITSHANKLKLDMPYREWISKENTKELELSLIPGKREHWNVTNYMDFVVKREELILQEALEALLPHFTAVSKPSGMIEETGEKTGELAKRHVRRLAFWKQFLERCNRKTELFKDQAPSKHEAIRRSIGKGNHVNLVIRYDSARVELMISSSDTEKNKSVFDKLYAIKQEIETDFGEQLDWQRLDDSRYSRIAKSWGKGLTNETEWLALQEEMIDKLIRLEKAMNKYLKKL